MEGEKKEKFQSHSHVKSGYQLFVDSDIENLADSEYETRSAGKIDAIPD